MNDGHSRPPSDEDREDDPESDPDPEDDDPDPDEFDELLLCDGTCVVVSTDGCWDCVGAWVCAGVSLGAALGYCETVDGVLSGTGVWGTGLAVDGLWLDGV